MNPIRLLCLASGIVAVSMFCGCAREQQPRAGHDFSQTDFARAAAADISETGEIEPVMAFNGPMPTGVAVSRSGRIFVNFPRWGDRVEFTVAEVKDGQIVPYPNAQINRLDESRAAECLVSVQSVVIDPQDRLWILDTGSINMQPVLPDAAKLICVDLQTNQIIKRIHFSRSIVPETSYLNDVRFDLNRGDREGLAYITDSSEKGPNGIIVVNLASQLSWRRLKDHPSTKAEPNFIPTVEGQPLMVREPGKEPTPIRIGSDGIAIDPKQGVLYYCPLAGRGLYSVGLDALSDPMKTDDDVAQTVKQMPPRDFASDGLECAPDGTLYLTDYENNAIRRLDGDRYEIVASDPRMIWPDSISIGARNYLYFTANQLNRQAKFHDGRDLRQRPFALFRTRIEGSSMASR